MGSMQHLIEYIKAERNVPDNTARDIAYNIFGSLDELISLQLDDDDSEEANEYR